MIAAVVGPMIFSLLVTYCVRGWARRVGFIDLPTGHKRHDSPVALGGGIAILIAIGLPILAGTAAAWGLHGRPTPAWLPAMLATHLDGMASKGSSILAILGGALVLHVVGLIDDRHPLGPRPKFVVEFLVALFISGVMGVRAIEMLPQALSVLLTVAWIVLMTNAFNFLDNMDGLSAGVAAIAAAIFAVASLRTGQVFVPLMACVMVGALLGYLVFNFAPATIFMGDAGSLPLGYLMSVLTVLTTFYDPGKGMTPFGLLVPFVVLAVPLYDVGSVVLHRLRAGDNPFRGDTRHFSHRLVRLGLSRRGAVLTVYLATAATGLPAMLLPRADWTEAMLVLVQCLSVVAMIAILEHVGRPK